MMTDLFRSCTHKRSPIVSRILHWITQWKLYQPSVLSSVGKNSKIAKYNSHLPGKFIIFWFKDPLAQKWSKSGGGGDIWLGPDPPTIADAGLAELELWRRKSKLGSQRGHTPYPGLKASPGQFFLVSTAVRAGVTVAVPLLACNKSELVSRVNLISPCYLVSASDGITAGQRIPL